MNKKTVLITGAAGFIGANLVKRLIKETSDAIVGVDSMNDYYDISLKEHRLAQIEQLKGHSAGSWCFVKGNIADRALVTRLF